MNREYDLPEELNQKIVDGLMEGYRAYLEVRREKSRSIEGQWSVCVGKRKSY